MWCCWEGCRRSSPMGRRGRGRQKAQGSGKLKEPDKKHDYGKEACEGKAFCQDDTTEFEQHQVIADFLDSLPANAPLLDEVVDWDPADFGKLAVFEEWDLGEEQAPAVCEVIDDEDMCLALWQASDVGGSSVSAAGQRWADFLEFDDTGLVVDDGQEQDYDYFVPTEGETQLDQEKSDDFGDEAVGGKSDQAKSDDLDGPVVDDPSCLQLRDLSGEGESEDEHDDDDENNDDDDNDGRQATSEGMEVFVQAVVGENNDEEDKDGMQATSEGMEAFVRAVGVDDHSEVPEKKEETEQKEKNDGRQAVGVHDYSEQKEKNDGMMAVVAQAGSDLAACAGYDDPGSDLDSGGLGRSLAVAEWRELVEERIALQGQAALADCFFPWRIFALEATKMAKLAEVNSALTGMCFRLWRVLVKVLVERRSRGGDHG